MSQSPTQRRRSEPTVPHGARVVPRCADIPIAVDALVIAFQPDPCRVRELRQTAATFLQGAGLREPLASDVVLTVSELVANAIVHGEGDVKLRIAVADDKVRVSVTDENPSPAVLKDPGATRESGRGLRLVDELADVWESLGEETWCEFRYGTGRDTA
ncbi:ATP-binding protein [Streptomyces cucumeris]|uniref:ATP-binding protein n=1 Tax=Streptomyces cucumeris TaxID=2962890 RepID=UPI003D704E39